MASESGHIGKAPDDHHTRLSDQEKWLVRRLKDGEADAFEEIYETYSGIVFKYGQSITTDYELLEDALQDLFIRLWKSRCEIEIQYSISFYLIKSFRRLVIKKIKESKGKQVQLRDYFHTLEVMNDPFLPADELPEIDSIKEVIKTLPAKQYEVIMLKFFYGYSNDRIADIMEITIESTYNLVARALSRLKHSI